VPSQSLDWDSAIALARGGFVERVSTRLAPVREFQGDEGLVFLEVASRVL
jgi:hypothetical protein